MKIFFFIITILLILVSHQLLAQTHSTNPYIVRTFVDENGNSIDEIIVPGKPPEHHREPAVVVPQPPYDRTVNILTNVPAFSWSFGCSATSAAMIAGYYDNTIFPEMYTGPTNGGVMPMNNSSWPDVLINGELRHQCPLSATRNGLDGLSVNGHVDDYWYTSNSSNDPYYGYWTEHGYADCTADYMGTNQYQTVGNIDGATTFFNYTNGTPLYDYSGGEPSRKDGCHGFREFMVSRGYNIYHNGSNYQNYSQYIYGHNGNTIGFTYAQFKAEIDAGRPVLIQVTGHTMVGYGYDSSANLVYIHDTWDYNTHTMTWSGSYNSMAHYGVTVFVLANPPGYGQADNSSDPTLPVIIDVEQIVIDERLVDPDVEVDPPCDVALNVSIQTYADAQNTIDYPDEVGISYKVDITGDFSTCTDICFTLFNLDLLLNYPIGAYWWNGSTWVNISSADWSISNQVSFCIPISNSRNGSTEIVLDRGGDSPLPVSLSSFTAIYSNGSPIINWVTQSESDNIGWNIFRAVSYNFGQAQILNLNTIPGNGTTSEPSFYSFTDEYEVQDISTYWYWLESISGSGETDSFGPVSLTIISGDDDIEEVPMETALHQNFPNPFNPSTLISFEIKENETGVLSIYNIKGQLIVKEEFGEGRHTYPWDARDHSSGIYLYKLQAKRYSKIMKMLLVK